MARGRPDKSRPLNHEGCLGKQTRDAAHMLAAARRCTKAKARLLVPPPCSLSHNTPGRHGPRAQSTEVI